MSLTESEKHTIRHYQYCGGDTSPIYKHFLSPWAQFCVDTFVPITMAPNTITLLGLVISILATVLTFVVNPTLEPGAPWWLHASTGLAIFAYQTLDNMDGKQARRTGSSSALGMFFDHACDSINAGVTIIAMGSVMGTGWTPLLFITYLAAFIPFYLQTWEEYYSHQMVLPPFNGPTEGLLMSIGLCFLSATFGSEFFHKPLLESPVILIQPDDSFLCSVGFPCTSLPVIRFISVISMTLFILLAYTSVTLLSSALQIVNTAKLPNGLQKHSVSGALFTLIPFLVYLPCVYFYSFYCKLGFRSNPIVLVSNLRNVIYCRQIISLIHRVN